jgi:hypothetical protein
VLIVNSGVPVFRTVLLLLLRVGKLSRGIWLLHNVCFAAFVNFSRPVSRINLILFVLDSVIQAASFDYKKPIIRHFEFRPQEGGGLILSEVVRDQNHEIGS